MKTSISNLLIVLFCLGVLPARAASNGDLCAQFFPDKLKTKTLRTKSGKAVNLTDYINSASADLDGTGTANYLVCVYFDHSHGAVRVIRNGSGGATMVAETTNVNFYGVSGGVELVDLDGDKKPEVVIGFMGFRGNESNWVFRWTGSSLQLMSPTSEDGLTEFGPIEYLDMSGDGKLSIVTQEPTRPTRDDDGNALGVPTASYTLMAGKLALSDTFYYQNQFKRKTGAPKEITDSFSVDDASKSYVLKIIDLNMSKPDAGPLTSSATISLNGKQIIGPNDFNPGKRTKVISRSVQVQSSNKLTVKMAGSPGSKILVILSQSP